MSRRVLTVLLALAAAVALGACEVRSRVGIDVAEDGSGVVAVSVRLDEEASRRLGEPAAALRLDDLAEAGWTVAPPETPDGALVLRAERAFASPEDLPRVLDEVGGVDGVFSEVALDVEDGFGRTTYDFAAHVELTGNPEQFGDDALTAALGGLALARTPEELALEGAADPAAMTLEVSVSLPGGVTETDGELRDGTAVWSFPVSGGEPTSADLTASAASTSSTTWVLLAVGVAALVAGVAAAVVGLRNRQR